MSTKTPVPKQSDDVTVEQAPDKGEQKPAKEIGGPKGLEPTRYGDWERKGIVSDF